MRVLIVHDHPTPRHTRRADFIHRRWRSPAMMTNRSGATLGLVELAADRGRLTQRPSGMPLANRLASRR